MRWSRNVLAVVCMGLVLVAGYSGDSAIDYDKEELIRYHVLAADNSAEKQADKLAVKDGVLAYLREDMERCSSVEEGRAYVLEHLDEIKTVAEAVLRERGAENEVKVYYGKFAFPLKYYGAFSLPGGEYEALRIVIGEGEGENWWCVLYPQMCLEAAGDTAYMEYEPPKELVVKWRVGEWWEKLHGES